MAISASGRSALLDRPQIPPHSSARTERPPFFRLKPAQAHLLRQHRWLPLKRTCCVNTAGLPVALPRVARFLLVPPVVLPRVARFLLAPPVVLCAGSFRVARWSYCASTASVLPPVYRAPTASVSCAGLPRADSCRIVRRSTARRQLPYRAPVYRAPTASVLPPVSCRQVSG